MTDEQLQQLIDSDAFDFLKVKPKSAAQTPDDERVFEVFQPIAEFIRENDFPPLTTSEDQTERRLAHQLEGLKNNPSCLKLLKEIDEFGLFTEDPEKTSAPTTVPESIDDILSDPDLEALLSGSDDIPDIYDLKHVPTPENIETPDFVAQRVRCDDFSEFEPLLLACQSDLKKKRRRLLPFANEQNIEPGHFYVLRGVLLYVAEVGEREIKNKKSNARLRCIFENGTESAMLLRSLSRELYKDGRRVTLKDEEVLDDFLVSDDDASSGFIYVLRSLSSDSQIKAIPNLYKIGLASSSVEDRIKNAKNEPTYLMDEVEIVASFEVYNVNLEKLEQLIHLFFQEVTVQVQVTDNRGNYHTPREWFSVPIGHIRRAIELLISGDIINFGYDPKIGISLIETPESAP